MTDSANKPGTFDLEEICKRVESYSNGFEGLRMKAESGLQPGDISKVAEFDAPSLNGICK